MTRIGSQADCGSGEHGYSNRLAEGIRHERRNHCAPNAHDVTGARCCAPNCHHLHHAQQCKTRDSRYQRRTHPREPHRGDITLELVNVQSVQFAPQGEARCRDQHTSQKNSKLSLEHERPLPFRSACQLRA